MRIRSLCAALLGRPPTDIYVVQVERVFLWIARQDEIDEAHAPQDVVDAFRSRGLIPPALFDHIQAAAAQPRVFAGDPPEDGQTACAVSLAACIFPNRAYQLQGQLPRRVAMFLMAYNDDPQDIVDLLSGNQLAGISHDELEELLGDLSSAGTVARRGNHLGEEWARERKNGAALYLSTWDKQDLEKILANWADDRELLRYLRTCLLLCPSDSANQPQTPDGRMDWGKIEADLVAQAQAAEVDPGENPARAIMLEKHSWRRAANRPRGIVPLPALPTTVTECWEFHSAKLISGFPYYSFRSHYARWWRQCVGTWMLNQLQGPVAGVADEYSLSDDELLFFREGYLLVRSTVFSREGSPERTAILREVADDLWGLRLERRLAAEGEVAAVKAIHAKHAGNDITMATVNMLNRRLRLRIWAYTLARAKGLSDEQIRNVRFATQKNASEYPLDDPNSLPGILTVASLARIVPPAHTLFWAYLAHRMTRSILEPQHPDPWTEETVAEEIWRWHRAGSFDLVDAAAAKEADPVNCEAARLMTDGPWRELLEAFRPLGSAPEAVDSIQGPSRNLWQLAWRAAIDRLRGLAGAKGLLALSPGYLAQWRQMAATCLVVPVWYLTFMEGLKPNQVLGRLLVGPDDRQDVLALIKAMK
ncbi:MAG: hypothetical protein ACYS8K_04040 [Planctomycetota bacterium]|jgi:hypothetical protein